MEREISVNYKIWFEKNGIPIIGTGGAKLIEAINETGNLQAAIKKIGWSYRYAWGYLKKLEKRLGTPIVETFKGGFKGGGGMKLSDFGRQIIRIYNRFNNFISDTLNNPQLWMAYGLKTKKSSVLEGEIKEVNFSKDAAHVSIEVPKICDLISIITSVSIENLGISVGDEVSVVIKATEIMLDKVID